MLKLLRFQWLAENAAWQKITLLCQRYPKTTSVALLLFWWCALNLILNLRAPLEQPGGTYLLPSLDSVVLLGVFALVGMASVLGARKYPALARLHIPGLVHIALGLVLLVVRVFRVGDGIAQTFQSRPANVFIDAPMLGELVRLLYTTMPGYQFALVIVGLLVALPSLVAIGYTCSSRLARLLRQPFAAAVFACVVAIFSLISLVRPSSADPEEYAGVFAASLVPRLHSDYETFAESRERTRKCLAALEQAERDLARSSGNLSRLQKANVLLMVVESYGATLLTEPIYAEGIEKLYDTLAASFESGGYHYASSLLDSSTNGGLSWLAHASLLTGVRVTNQADAELVWKKRPKNLGSFFRKAGYQTVTAEPGTTRKSPNLYKFHTRIIAPEFGYKGPRFSWAPMADQFVVDKVHRDVVSKATRPLFIRYSLVSSHGPWNIQPPFIDDWSKIGDGSIYNRTAPVTFPTSWTDLEEAQGPYLRSIDYSMEVIRSYLEQFVRDGSLIIILGDHQPTGKITNQSKDSRVPIHVVSRNRALIDVFIRLGYVTGMRPDLTRPAPGIETFPIDFVAAFSDPH